MRSIRRVLTQAEFQPNEEASINRRQAAQADGLFDPTKEYLSHAAVLRDRMLTATARRRRWSSQCRGTPVGVQPWERSTADTIQQFRHSSGTGHGPRRIGALHTGSAGGFNPWCREAQSTGDTPRFSGRRLARRSASALSGTTPTATSTPTSAMRVTAAVRGRCANGGRLPFADQQSAAGCVGATRRGAPPWGVQVSNSAG